MISGIINKISTASSLSKPEIEVLVGAITTANENTTNITENQSISQNPPTSAFMPTLVNQQNKQEAEQEVSQEPRATINQKNLTITLESGKIYKFPNAQALQDFISEAGL